MHVAVTITVWNRSTARAFGLWIVFLAYYLFFFDFVVAVAHRYSNGKKLHGERFQISSSTYARSSNTNVWYWLATGHASRWICDTTPMHQCDETVDSPVLASMIPDSTFLLFELILYDWRRRPSRAGGKILKTSKHQKFCIFICV